MINSAFRSSRLSTWQCEVSKSGFYLAYVTKLINWKLACSIKRIECKFILSHLFFFPIECGFITRLLEAKDTLTNFELINMHNQLLVGSWLAKCFKCSIAYNIPQILTGKQNHVEPTKRLSSYGKVQILYIWKRTLTITIKDQSQTWSFFFH